MTGNPHPAGTPAPRNGFWRHTGTALLFLGAYFFVQFLVMIPYLLLVATRIVLAGGMESAVSLLHQILQTAAAQSELVTGVIDLIALGAFALLLKLMRRPVLASAGIVRIRPARLLPLIPLGASLNVLLTSLLSLLPASALEAYMEAAGPALLGQYGALSVLILTVLAPLTEEVLFRGLIYGSLKKAMPRWLAILAASAVFGLMHGQLLWMLYTALLGAFFCLIRDRYATLWASILLHMSFNAGSYLVMQMQRTPIGVALPVSCAVAAVCLYLAFRHDASTEPSA